MPMGRRVRGFERAGSLPPGQLGLPAGRARELVLQRAWRRVAGEAIARRAIALHIRRGVLEIAVADAHWAATLTELIPRLAGRLAASFPELGVRKFRLRREGDDRRPPATVIEPERADPAP